MNINNLGGLRLGNGQQNLYVFEVNRKEVERKDVTRLIKTLKQLEKNQSMANSVWIIFHGYDADEREIMEIDEIRQWTKIAFYKIPHLLYYLNRGEEGINNMLSCYLDMEMFFRGERLNAYQVVERGLQNNKSIQIKLTIPNQLWYKWKKEIIKHGEKMGEMEQVKKTISYVEGIFS